MYLDTCIQKMFCIPVQIIDFYFTTVTPQKKLIVCGKRYCIEKDKQCILPGSKATSCNT